MTHYDVAIVGAGPAGCWAAHRLACHGARVALIDGSHPREKACGGGVTGRALDLVGAAVPLERVPSVVIERATFANGPAEARMPIDTSRTPLRVFARRDFDLALHDAATRAGAVSIETRATGFERRPDGSWTVLCGSQRIEGRWLIGADGAGSLVRRRLLRPFGRAQLSLATGYYVDCATNADIDIAFEDSPPGYLWSFPRPDHLAVGICAQADESAPAPLLRRVDRWVRQHVPTRGVMRRYSWPIPSLDERALSMERVAGDRWMLLGDAAGFVDPITREGIYFALRSANAAADALARDANPAGDYLSVVRDTIGGELVRAARLKARFFQPRFTGLLVHALQRSPRIQAVMADLVAGRQTYHGLRRRLLGTLELKLMLELSGL